VREEVSGVGVWGCLCCHIVYHRGALWV
jgi:hypothetical protein